MENDKKKHDVLYGFVNKVVDERNKGKSLVFVDDRLLEWMDEQVDAGKYSSRSHAIEYALTKIKEREKSKTSLKVLGHDSADTINEDYLQRLADSLPLTVSKIAVKEALNECYGDDNEAKIRALQNALEKARQGLITLPSHRRKAFAAVLSNLRAHSSKVDNTYLSTR